MPVIFNYIFIAVLTLANLAGSWCFGETFPAGDIPLTETKVLPHVAGGSIQGAGDGQHLKPASKYRGEVTAFLPDAGILPALKLTGTNWLMERFLVKGNGTGIGLLVTNRGPTGKHSLGPGKHQLNNLSFESLETGIQFGEELRTLNCDSVVAENLWFRQCKNGVKTVNQMGMTNTFRDTNTSGVENVFVFEAGGKVDMHGIDVAGKTYFPGAVIRLVGTGRINKQGVRIEEGIGNNSNVFSASDIYIDHSSGGNMALVRVDNHMTYPARVTLRGGHISYDDYLADGKYQLVLKNPCTVKLEDFVNLQAGTFFVEYDPSYPPVRILINNCSLSGLDHNGDGQFDAADLLADSTVPVCLTARDCDDAKGNSLPNVYMRELAK
jgi:hypothetical protein